MNRHFTSTRFIQYSYFNAIPKLAPAIYQNDIYILYKCIIPNDIVGYIVLYILNTTIIAHRYIMQGRMIQSGMFNKFRYISRFTVENICGKEGSGLSVGGDLASTTFENWKLKVGCCDPEGNYYALFMAVALGLLFDAEQGRRDRLLRCRSIDSTRLASTIAMFGVSRQCHIRNQQTLYRRILGGIHKADDTVERTGIGEYVLEVKVIIVRPLNQEQG